MSTPRYSSDRPNKPPDPDLLGRDGFAQRLASDIKAWKSNDSLVIALYGSWGCGKTSLKERILSHLQAAEEDYPIVDFNPWQLSGSGNLAMAYFRELDAILKSGKAGEHSAKAARRLASYTRHLSLLGTATKWIAPLFAAQNPELAATIAMAGEGVNQIGEVTRKASQALQEEVADRSLDEIKKALFE